MKRALLLALACVVLGCDTQEPVADMGGEVSFLLDGQEWAVSAQVSASHQYYGYLLTAS